MSMSTAFSPSPHLLEHVSSLAVGYGAARRGTAHHNYHFAYERNRAAIWLALKIPKMVGTLYVVEKWTNFAEDDTLYRAKQRRCAQASRRTYVPPDDSDPHPKMFPCLDL